MKVTTIDGAKHPKGECRRISGNYYKIGDPKIENSGQCYLINDKYYKYDTGYIVYDHRQGSYVIKNLEIMNRGIVGFEEDNTPIFGFFSNEKYMADPIVNIKGIHYNCIDEELLKENKKYLEDLETGIYYDRTQIPAIKFVEPAGVSLKYKSELNYDSRGITKSAMKIHKKLYKPKVYNNTVNEFGSIMGDLTFGLEFETTKGIVPSRICNKLGLIPLRDGSINGLEYVTIPLHGKDGLQALLDSVYELNKRTEFDEHCSLHLHIGNIPRTERFFLALYKTLCVLQDKLFEFFPIYKKYNFKVKRKHYTKPFNFTDTIFRMDPFINDSNIKRNFDILYRFLSMGRSYSEVGFDLDQVKGHPSDPEGTRKWEIRTRYHFVNLIPLLFGNKQTIEFRLHTPTYDVNKILRYMTLCSAVIHYVIKRESSILEGKFTDDLHHIVIEGLEYCMSSKNNIVMISDLMEYLTFRRNYIYNCISKGDIIANEDDFKLSFKGKRINWDSFNKNKLDECYKKPIWSDEETLMRGDNLESIIQPMSFTSS